MYCRLLISISGTTNIVNVIVLYYLINQRKLQIKYFLVRHQAVVIHHNIHRNSLYKLAPVVTAKQTRWETRQSRIGSEMEERSMKDSLCSHRKQLDIDLAHVWHATMNYG